MHLTIYWQKNVQVFKFLKTFRKQHINKDEQHINKDELGDFNLIQC